MTSRITLVTALLLSPAAPAQSLQPTPAQAPGSPTAAPTAAPGQPDSSTPPASAPIATPTRTPGVDSIRSMRDTPATTTPLPARKRSYTVAAGATAWADSGLVVQAGETLPLTATGTLTLTDGRAVTPAGLPRGWKDLLRQFPLNAADTGELLGRVSDLAASVPFPIGTAHSAIMPTTGRFYLRANLSDDLAATGTFTVTLRPEPLSSTTRVATRASAPVTPIADLVSPALFTTIPRRVGDQAGDPGDMVNFALVGSQADVESAFKAAGWTPVDRSTGAAVLHGLLSTLNHEAYTEMPMSTLFLFGRPQDLSFARADPLTVAAERHHLRVWRTSTTLAGRPLWVGSATHDIGFERDQRNGGTTHKIDPDIDLERTFLLQSFDAAGDLRSAAYVLPADPLRAARTATGGTFHSDGRIAILDLKPELPAATTAR